MTPKEKEEIRFWRKAIGILKRGYGADCKTNDLDDFAKDFRKMTYDQAISEKRRCGSCRAKETIRFLEDHIDLIKM